MAKKMWDQDNPTALVRKLMNNRQVKDHVEWDVAQGLSVQNVLDWDPRETMGTFLENVSDLWEDTPKAKSANWKSVLRQLETVYENGCRALRVDPAPLTTAEPVAREEVNERFGWLLGDARRLRGETANHLVAYAWNCAPGVDQFPLEVGRRTINTYCQASRWWMALAKEMKLE